MAHNYVPVDRDQLFLLPPDMREWLGEDHLAWFVIDVVSKVDTSALHERHPNNGVGRPAYDPDMMLALLIYAYCTKVRSSREIERLCLSDVAYRVLSSDQKPDHSTIARFRVHFADFAKKLFGDVLVLAKEAGASSVGVVAIDGTKMAANASRKQNRTRAAIDAEVDRMFAEAEAIDAAEDKKFGDKRGDELPPELSTRDARKKTLDKALAALEERKNKEPTPTQERERDELIESSRHREFRSLQRLRKAMREEREARKRNEARIAEGQKRKGRPRLNGQDTHNIRRERSDYEANKARRKEFEQRTGVQPKADARVNLTDPDSQLMHGADGAWIQAFNAQAAVNEEGIVVGSLVTNAANDLNQLIPIMELIEENLARAGIENNVGTVIADAGYLSKDNLEAPGPDRLIANGKAWKMKKKPPTTEVISPAATPTERNAHRLLTEEGRTIYSKRQHMIEPVFGHTKGNKGFRRFLQRGIEAVSAEWDLMMATHNVQKLYLRGQ